MLMRQKVFSILALLLMAVTGAWAQNETLLTTITATAKEQASYSTANVATVSFSYTAYGSSAYLANWGWWGYGWTATVTAAEGYTITKCIFYDDANRTATDSEAPFVVETTEEDKTPRINGTPIDGGNMWSKGIKKIEVYGYVTPTATQYSVTLAEGTDDAGNWTISPTTAEEGQTVTITYNGTKKVKSVKAVTKTANNNEWTLTMPTSDVELQVEYYDELTDNEDNTTLLASLNGQTTDIYLNRTLSTAKWYTLCLPFGVDLSADGPLKGVTAKTLSSVTNNGTTLTVTFGEAVTTLEAGKPYIVRLPEDATVDIVEPLLENVVINSTLTNVTVSGATFKGTYMPVTLTAPDKKKLFLQDNKLYYPATDATIKAFRAYIELDAEVPDAVGAPNIVLNFDGDSNATGIVSAEANSSLFTLHSSLSEWYTLDGHELSGKPAQKGVYIHNGRKEVVK